MNPDTLGIDVSSAASSGRANRGTCATCEGSSDNSDNMTSQTSRFDHLLNMIFSIVVSGSGRSLRREAVVCNGRPDHTPQK
jgi:hypothetical protein